MNILTLERTISIGHRLPSYKGVCSSPHGHNARVVFTCGADIFVDFKELDTVFREVLEPFDHSMTLLVGDPLLDALMRLRMRYVAISVEPTTEALASLFFGLAKARVEELRCVLREVTVHETAKYAATVSSENPVVYVLGKYPRE